MTSEDTGHFPTVPGPAATLPPFPSPGPGARLLIAVAVVALRMEGTDPDVVDAWRTAAYLSLTSPTTTIPPEH